MYDGTRRKIPLPSATGGRGDITLGSSPHGSQHHDIHDIHHNIDIKHEEEKYTTNCNYISDKPRMSLRERYYIKHKLSFILAGIMVADLQFEKASNGE